MASSAAVLTVVTPPRYGAVAINSAGDLVYRRDATHDRPDVLVYRLADYGRTDDATVTLRIATTQEATGS